MPDFNHNVWAPWRMDYIRSLSEEAEDVGCFLCHYWKDPAEDERNLVLWRGQAVFVVMNRFPYTGGHLLIAPQQHTADLGSLGDDVLLELTTATRDAMSLLSAVLDAQGFNVGSNFGRCAGAGLPDHIHTHVVPRWAGDTNYMSVLGGTRVIPEALDATYRLLADKAAEMDLRQPITGDSK